MNERRIIRHSSTDTTGISKTAVVAPRATTVTKSSGYSMLLYTRLNAVRPARHIEVQRTSLLAFSRAHCVRQLVQFPGSELGKTCHQRGPLPRFFATTLIQLPRKNRAARLEFQPGVSRCFRMSVHLEGILTFDIGREFGDVRFAFVDTSIAESRWNVNGVVLPKFEFTPACFCERTPRQTD